MWKSKWALAALFACFVSVVAHAECTKPVDPPKSFPDGATASLKTMLAAKSKVDTYVKTGQAYVDCMDKSEAKSLKQMNDKKDMSKDDRAAKLQALDARRKERNEVVTGMKSTATAFNAEIHKYQAHNKK